MCNFRNTFFKFLFHTKIFGRKKILLIDNIFNDKAELIDNFTLFEYLQKDPKFKKISYYIINKNNEQFSQISKKYKNIIPLDDCSVNFSLMRKLLTAKYWLDSFQVLNKLNLQTYFKESQIINVYTQHGINYFKSGFWGKQDIGEQTFRKIIFSNKREQILFKQYYSYNDENTILAGLARWDLMKDITQPTDIFAYFTFRTYLRDPSLNIEETTYYQNILKLVSSEKLNALLKKHNISLNLALHHEVFRYLHQQLDQIGNIKLIPDVEIGQVKQKSSLLITDYSSMCFDFMFKNRPVVFYRLDKDEPLLNNDNESKINNENVEAKNHELYNICYNAEDVVNIIEKYLNNNFQLETENIAKNDTFFTYRENICEHIIQGILNSPENVYNPRYAIPQQPISFETTYHFSSLSNHYVLTGVSTPEKWGSWSNSEIVKLSLKIPFIQKHENILIKLNLKTFLNKKRKKQIIKIYANDLFLKKTKITQKNRFLKLNIPADMLKDGLLCIQFDVKNPKSPKELKLSEDTRKLGIGFQTMQISKCTAVQHENKA